MGYILKLIITGIILIFIGASLLVGGLDIICEYVSFICPFRGIAWIAGIILIIIGALMLLVVPLQIFGLILLRTGV